MRVGAHSNEHGWDANVANESQAWSKERSGEEKGVRKGMTYRTKPLCLVLDNGRFA